MPKHRFTLTVILRVLGPVLAVITPELREMVGQGLNNWYRKARLTDNGFDDLFVEVLADLLSIELEDGEE